MINTGKPLFTKFNVRCKFVSCNNFVYLYLTGYGGGGGRGGGGGGGGGGSFGGGGGGRDGGRGKITL